MAGQDSAGYQLTESTVGVKHTGGLPLTTSVEYLAGGAHLRLSARVGSIRVQSIGSVGRGCGNGHEGAAVRVWLWLWLWRG